MKAVEYAEKANEIFVLSDSFLRIKELIDDETSTIDDIAEVILIDPALAATVLKLANSSFFNYPGKIDTISKAVLVLGITEVYNLVIAYFTTDAFKKIDADAKYLENYWECSVDCALLIKYLGESLRVPNAERLFILGLLHNLGELVVKQFMPEQLAACQPDSAESMPWQLQQQTLGFTFGECTAELLKIWQLPYSLIEPVREQDNDDLSHASDETKLLYLAKRLMWHNSHFPKESLDKFIAAEQLEAFTVDKELVRAAVNYCDLERLAVLSVLKPSSLMIY
ncbi:HDOD domain-containing protein [Thalassotalea euphylliae]|uniref:HDOD domain-containing protein n=1 Tax=Thalassotalea euphylliae TaxID=1655234 RepID=A0A3E0UPC7_9GAMM|nr:HDOD domain-containing protein [Thalassotalea euphylliae]REL37492.1 HDOD domain-containing protein [Thalassotalea euphylliae]